MKKVMNFMCWEYAGVQLKYNANDNFVQTADVTSDQGFPAGTPSLLSDTVLVKTKLYWSDRSVTLCPSYGGIRPVHLLHLTGIREG